MDHSEFLETSPLGTEEKSLSIGLATEPVQVLLTPHIGVIGVGGAGGNAVNNMIESNLGGISFFAANTDAQALTKSLASERIQLGLSLTRGLGAGANPEVGKMAAEESEDKIKEYLTGLHLLFITAGMGGGTGTGAAPVIARIAKEMGILTVGVVSKPFKFEGMRRMKAAEAGTAELQKYVDTLILIPNQNLFRVIGDKTPMVEAFKVADGVLCQGVRSITDLVMNPGLINLDFADVQTVIRQMGRAMMGTGEASNEENRALIAAEKAITNPLLDDSSIKGARSILINVSGGPDMTLQEVDIATERITAELAEDANIIFGTCSSEEDTGKIRISLIATGLPVQTGPELKQEPKKTEEPAVTVDAPFMPQPIPTEEPVEEQPTLIQTPPSQAPINISSSIVLGDVNVLTDIPESKEPPLLKEEQPVLATPVTVDVPVEVRPTIVEPKKKETVSVKYKSSLFDWIPGFTKPTEEKTDSTHSKGSSIEDDQFKLPEFLRTK